MPTTVIDAALADVRAQVWAAQVALVRAGAATWTGAAADTAEARRTDLLATLRRCEDALDALDRLAVAARRAEQVCHASATSGTPTLARPVAFGGAPLFGGASPFGGAPAVTMGVAPWG